MNAPTMTQTTYPMSTTKTLLALILLAGLLAPIGCVPAAQRREVKIDQSIPKSYGDAYSGASSSAALARWDKFFEDPNLIALIGQALKHNQELNILVQDINIANNEILARRGEYLPRAGVGLGVGVDTPGRYEGEGGEAGALIEEEPKLGRQRYEIGFLATWEVDIWKKLRNASKVAVLEYLASIEGRHYAVTNLVSEIATSYYELLALDTQLKVILSNVEIQENALKIVLIQKEAARVTELAVQRFEAEVLHTKSRQFDVLQEITQVENRLNFLVGRFPQPIARNAASFITLMPKPVQAGLPTKLLENRPDIRQAEFELKAADLNVKVARATFYPSLKIDAGIGYSSDHVTRLFATPESLIIGAVANLFTPLLNRKAIEANYASANAKQIRTAYHYERTVLMAYMEAATQLALIGNLQKSYDLQSQQVERLNKATEISGVLFKSARADYLEVLTTRREALESQLELVETKRRQLIAVITMYKALGGGWRDNATPARQNKPHTD